MLLFQSSGLVTPQQYSYNAQTEIAITQSSTATTYEQKATTPQQYIHSVWTTTTPKQYSYNVRTETKVQPQRMNNNHTTTVQLQRTNRNNNHTQQYNYSVRTETTITHNSTTAMHEHKKQPHTWGKETNSHILAHFLVINWQIQLNIAIFTSTEQPSPTVIICHNLWQFIHIKSNKIE